MDLFFIWLVTFVAGFWICKKIKEWQNLPPGPWGLPILGYLPFIDPKQPHLTLTKLSKVYGPMYGLKMGSVHAVVLSDHKLIRDAFAKENFSGRAPLYLTHGIMHGNGIICAEGGLWKDQRKLVTSWLKSFGMSKHSLLREKLEKRVANGAHELLEDIEKSSEAEIDLPYMLTNSVGNVVNEIIFGFKFPPDDKTWHWLRKIQEEGCHEMGVAGVVNFLPFVRFFSSSIRNTIQMLIRGQAQTHTLYASVIARRRSMLGLEMPKGAEYLPHRNLFNEYPDGRLKCIKYSKHAPNTEHIFDPKALIPTEGECILDSFLMEQKKRFETGDEAAQYMTDEQLHFLLADMFGAGLDTTSVTLAWFLLYMALYPDEQLICVPLQGTGLLYKRENDWEWLGHIFHHAGLMREIVRNEILSEYPEECEVEYSRLPRLMAAIYETQRIRSIVPVGIPHGCLEDTYLGNYKIPKGAMVIPLQWALHMDPDVWEDPEEFRPSRFLAPDGSLLKPQEFIPFQTGKRMCPGDELSRMLASGFIARLFRCRRIRLASKPPSEEQMQGTVGVTLAPPHVQYYCETL